MNNEIDMHAVYVQWHDSYGALTGWQDLDTLHAAPPLLIHSWGVIVQEDDTAITLAQNYAAATDYTPRQANGIIVIPKAAIVDVHPITSINNLICQI